jgi:NAD+ kinase
MRFVIIEKKDEQSQAVKQQIISAFQSEGFVYDEKTPKLVISIGGDGTMLEAFRLYDRQLNDVAFVGIHSGHLGFYTDWMLSEVDAFITAVLTSEPAYEQYPVLEGQIIFAAKEERILALNEIIVADYRKTLALNVDIDGRHFETFRGTGVSICTPSGSTGYNKSGGGAIIHPSLQTFQLTEIASVNNNVFRTIGSSIVLGQNENIRLKPLNLKDDLIFNADLCSFKFTCDEPVQAFNIRIAQTGIIFARYRPMDFWQRVRRSFI